MRQVKTAAIALCAALVLSACTSQPIYNVNDAVVSTTSGKSLTPGQVRSAIITAGTSLGWRVVDTGPGHLEGTLRLREHTAVVDIPYSASKFSIVFKRGENLDVREGLIHRNYNGWVSNLERSIRAELSRI